MDVAQIQCGPASPQKNGPKRQVGLDVLVLVPFHPARGFCRPRERGQRGLGILSREHVKRLDANTPLAAQINNVISETLIFKPGTLFIAALYNFPPVAPLLRTVPDDEAALSLLADEKGTVALAPFQPKAVILEIADIGLKVFSQEPGEHASFIIVLLDLLSL